jgi:hypothetical protein
MGWVDGIVDGNAILHDIIARRAFDVDAVGVSLIALGVPARLVAADRHARGPRRQEDARIAVASAVLPVTIEEVTVESSMPGDLPAHGCRE